MTEERARRSSSMLVLCGGVGGAKLAEGLAGILDPEDLQIVVNTGDDFDWYGLRVCPDLDTVMYALCGRQDRNRGWGLESETWHMLEMLKGYGTETWFQIGDRDLATHVLRTALLRKGHSLSWVTNTLAKRLGTEVSIYPMTDDPVRTEVMTSAGWLSFQEYFVRERYQPEIHDIRFVGLETARPSTGLLSAIDRATAIVLAPSNPIVSIGPILQLPGVIDRLERSRATKIGVSPLIARKALKGPAAEMLRTEGVPVSAAGIASLYASFLDGFLIDRTDEAKAAEVASLDVRPILADILMQDSAGKRRLARQVLREVGWPTDGD